MNRKTKWFLFAALILCCSLGVMVYSVVSFAYVTNVSKVVSLNDDYKLNPISERSSSVGVDGVEP